MTLVSALNRFLDEGIPFVSYRLPFQNEPVSLVGGIFSEVIPGNEIPFFVFAPFDSDNKNPTRYFAFHKKFKGFNPDGLLQMQPASAPKLSFGFDEPYVADFEDYLHQAGSIVDMLKSKEVNKVVLSRVIRYGFEKPLSAGETFLELCKKYPEAFVYFLNDGKTEQWIGASPETLLQVEDGKGLTMSLAGTQAVCDRKINEIIWQPKELDEQKFVTDYIAEKLQNCDATSIKKSETETVFAGKLAHLRTLFQFEMPEKSNILPLAQNLHPTPAVCGSPTEKALEIIRGAEKHDRSYYSGYLGLIENPKNARVFVNLRCMRINRNSAFLYVGGGLTAESDVLKEWEETLLKAETLMTVIANNSRNL